MRFLTPAVVLLALVACGPKEPPAPPPVVPTAEQAAPAKPAWSAARAEKQVDEAVSLLLSGTKENAAKANELLTEVVRNEPDMVEAIYNQGIAHQILGDGNEAKRRFLRATDLEPGFAPAWQNLGALSEREGQFQQALNYYKQGLARTPDDGDLQVAVIGALRKLGRDAEAIEQARNAIRTNGDNIGAYNNLGLVYLGQGKLELAQFVYERAEQVVLGAKDDPLIQANLGRVYLAQEKKGAARDKLTKAISLNEALIAPRMALASLYMDDRDWDSTIETLLPALALEPDNASIQVNLGIAYRGQGKYEDAIKAYKKALELDPRQVDVYLNLALIYGDSMNSYGDAFAALDSYDKGGGTRAALSAERRAEFEAQQKRYDRAQKRKQRADEQKRKREEDAKLAKAAEERLRKQKEEEERQANEAPPPPPPPAPAPAPDAGGAWGGTAAPANSSALGTPCTARGACGDSALECANDAVCREVGTAGTFGQGVGCMQSADCAYGLTCNANQCAEGADGGTPWGN